MLGFRVTIKRKPYLPYTHVMVIGFTILNSSRLLLQFQPSPAPWALCLRASLALLPRCICHIAMCSALHLPHTQVAINAFPMQLHNFPSTSAKGCTGWSRPNQTPLFAKLRGYSKRSVLEKYRSIISAPEPLGRPQSVGFA